MKITRTINKKSLIRRRELIGAQGVFCLATIWQPFVMFFTTQTAISRFDDAYPLAADILAITTIISIVLLYIDFLGSIADLYFDKDYCSTRVFEFIDKNRPWFLYCSAIWSLMLMTTVSVEAGIGAIFSYGLFFFGMAFVGLFMALRDGCIDNQMQKDAECLNS